MESVLTESYSCSKEDIDSIVKMASLYPDNRHMPISHLFWCCRSLAPAEGLFLVELCEVVITEIRRHQGEDIPSCCNISFQIVEWVQDSVKKYF